MLRMFSLDALRNKVRNAGLFIQMAVLAIAGIAPILHVGTAGAEQLTSRKVTISTSKPAATGVNYNLQFSWAGNQAPKSIIVQFCSDPLGACKLPGDPTSSGYAATGKEMLVTGGTRVSDSGLPTPLSTQVTSTSGACNDVGATASTMLCFNTSTTPTAASGTNATFNLTGLKNPGLPDAANYKTVYVRVSAYDQTAFSGTKVLDGTVATSINQQLTVNGRVQERLNFCVAAIADDGTTADSELPATTAACGALTSASVIDLGVIDNSGIAKSPVANSPPTSLGNNRYGIAMLNTNASNGTAITYFAEPDTTSGSTNQLRSFRVPGAACSTTATTLTDQCFVSADGTTGTTFVAGTEKFGMNVPCLIQQDGTHTLPASVAPTTGNLQVDTPYNGDGTVYTAADCEKSEPAAEKYAWNDTSTASPIAESSTTGSKVIDNEIVKLNFAATAGATTPTGSYTVVSTYIATPTF